MRHVAPGVAYLLSSYAALLVFSDQIHQIRPRAADLSSTYLAWYGQMLLLAGFFALTYLAVVSFFSGQYRSSRRGEAIVSSAACAVISAFLFAIGLRIALAVTDRVLIPGFIIAVVSVVLPARFVLESLRRRSNEDGITTSRGTAVLLSAAYAVSCNVALILAHLPMWPTLHLYPDLWNPEFQVYVPPFFYYYEIFMQLLFHTSALALTLWFLHALVLASFFRRWRDIPQRSFAFGSVASGLLAVVLMEVTHLTPLIRIWSGEVDNILFWWVMPLLAMITTVLLPAFVMFDSLARRHKQRVLAAYRPAKDNDANARSL